MAEPGDNCGPTTESEDPFVPDEVVDRVSPGSGQEETKSRRTAKPSGKAGKRRASGSCTPETKGPKRRRRAVTRKASTKRRRSVTKKSGGSKRRCTNTANPKRRRGNTKKGRSCSGGGRVPGLNGSPCIRRPGGPRGIIKKPSKPTGQRCSSPSVKKPRKNFKPAVGPENRKRPPGVFVSYYLDLLKRDQKEAGKKASGLQFLRRSRRLVSVGRDWTKAPRSATARSTVLSGSGSRTDVPMVAAEQFLTKSQQQALNVS